MERISNEEQTITNYFVSEAYDIGGYIAVNKNLIRILGLLESIVLGNYISKSKYFKENNPEYKSWFFLTHESQMEELNLGERVIRRCKQELIQKGILETRSKGIPAKEWLRIDLNNLAKLMTGQDLSRREGNTSQDEMDINNNKYNNNKYKIHRDLSKNPSKEKNKTYLPLAKILANIVISNKNVYLTPSQINGWTNEIRRLVETSKIPYKRVEKVLQWYKNNYGGKYIPVIQSGASLREKFLRLEAAMEKDGYRDNNEKEEKYEPTILPDRIKRAYKTEEED